MNPQHALKSPADSADPKVARDSARVASQSSQPHAADTSDPRTESRATSPLPVLKSPAECTEAELAAFEAALIERGETASPTLSERIRRADCLAFVAGADGRLCGTGALKSPKPEHCAGVFKRAGAQAPPERFSLELGWLVGDDKTTARIIAALTARAGERPVFSITRADDAALHASLREHGFRPDGAAYASPRGAYSNQIYLRGM